MDFSFMIETAPRLIEALPITIFIFIVATILATVLGILIAMLRERKLPILTQLMWLYASFFRSIPGLLVILLVYYGLPFILMVFGINIGFISRVTYAIVALVLYNSAHISEIFRAAYRSIPESQFDAARSIGMTRRQMSFRIILPQVFPVAWPSVGNAVIEILKDTSILYLIGLVDIMGQAEIIIANTFGIYQLEVYFVIAIIYWILSSFVGWILDKVERRLSKYKGGEVA